MKYKNVEKIVERLRLNKVSSVQVISVVALFFYFQFFLELILLVAE